MAVLLDDPKIDSVPELRGELEAAIKEIRALAEPVRKYRHKAVAHLDFAVTVKVLGAELPQLSKSQIEKCLSAMEAAYCLVSGKVYSTGTSFQLGTLGDAKSLVTALQDAQKWRLSEIQRLRINQSSPPRSN
jgi:hypothetical protein